MSEKLHCELFESIEIRLKLQQSGKSGVFVHIARKLVSRGIFPHIMLFLLAFYPNVPFFMHFLIPLSPLQKQI